MEYFNIQGINRVGFVQEFLLHIYSRIFLETTPIILETYPIIFNDHSWKSPNYHVHRNTPRSMGLLNAKLRYSVLFRNWKRCLFFSYLHFFFSIRGYFNSNAVAFPVFNSNTTLVLCITSVVAPGCVYSVHGAICFE